MIKFLRHKISWTAGLIFACSFSFLLSPSTFADVYTASISTSSLITVDVLTSKQAAVKSDNVSVTSTCPLGYDLTISGPSDSTLYKGGDTTASSISASTGTPASPKPLTGDTYLNTWGYSLDPNTTISSNTFIGLSSTPNTLISKQTASATGGDNKTIYYGASADQLKEPGAYTMANNGTIVYTLTANINCGNFNIVYDGNDDDGDTTMSVDHQNVHEGDDVDLYAPNFIKEGYGFAGWSTVQLDPDANNFQANLQTAISENKVYGPNETVTANATFLRQADNTNTVTLYAIWVPSSGYIQSWRDCGNLSIGGVIALTDQRDGNVYTVSRLADGNCWMTENLRLDNQYTMGNNTIDPSVTNESLAQGYGTTQIWGGGYIHTFVGLATSESSNYGTANSNSVYISDDTGSIYDPTTTPVTLQDIGTGNSPEYRFPRYNNLNTASTVSDMTNANQNVYSYGNYYTWAAAIADTAAHSTNAETITATSICPAGWYLPYGNLSSYTNGNFTNLDTSLGGTGDHQETAEAANRWRKFPNNFVNAGAINDGTISERGESGSYFSSTVANAQYVTHAGIGSDDIWPGNGWVDKSNGESIRCVAQRYYRIHFDANGGTGTMDDQWLYRGQTANLNANTFTLPSGLSFLGWNTKADGSGTSYTDGQSVLNIAAAYSSITLYAQWNQPNNLYETVASMTKGTQTAADLQATITASNSGVYTYNSSVFGADSDGTKSDSTKATIYYYRGILDETTGTYGSDGDGKAYPNYVVLSSAKTTAGIANTDTCWRIIRTTGSGGVKMIYNGKWTGSTCANATTAASITSPVATSTFSAANATAARQVVRTGYTYNNSYANTSSTTATAVNTLFGNNTSSYSSNSTNSTVKGNVETWFNNTLSGYSDILEPNAGYCNDRSAFQNNTGATATSQLIPYTTSTSTGATYRAFFGAYTRNLYTSKLPGLGCSRNKADIYSTDASTGGNGQLSAPTALITADEASFAGSGSSTASQGSAFNEHSFLRTGSNFWTMSPHTRNGSYTYNFILADAGNITFGRVDNTNYIRPVISLKEDTVAMFGSGTAVDPWVVSSDPIYEIVYEKNGADVTGSGADGQSFRYKKPFTWSDSQTTYTLRPENFKRDGYGFAGWSTDPNVASHINDNDHSYIYGSQALFNTSDYNLVSNADSNNIIHLYAVWVPSAGNLQNWSGCSSLGAGKVTALTDTRDNQTYAVAKLADGNCWVIENYRLNTNTATITAANTNSPTSSFITEAANTSPTTLSDWCGLFTSDCPNEGDEIQFNLDNINNLSTKTAFAGADYGYGVYYNWYTATAGNGLNSQKHGNTNGDLCPAGWHIPTGGVGGELSNLFRRLGDTFHTFPNNFVGAGIIADQNGDGISDIRMRETSGFIVSSSAYWENAYAIMTYDLQTNPTVSSLDGGSSYKTRGMTFRCIAGT